MTRYLLVYCFEQHKMDGVDTRIASEGVYPTWEEAEAADEALWKRFEEYSTAKRPAYLLTSEIIEIEI